MPSAHAIFAFMDFLPSAFCIFAEKITIQKDMGSTQSAARAILQSKKNKLIAIIVVDISEPTSSGIQCEDAVSSVAQSAIIVLVRSDKSFLPKNERGIFLNFSARAILLIPLSLYVAKKLDLYWKYVATKMSARLANIPQI